MLTQEELAEKLCVSRQTITKWETGTISPSLEYLIDLSAIFGVSIDTLIKDDDCLPQTMTETNVDAFIQFIVQAKQCTYAAKKGKLVSARLASHEYAYKNDDYTYTDSFLGSTSYVGHEIVYEHDIPIWSMNYYGEVLSEDFSGDFLKEALLQVSINRPYRGPEYMQRGEYTYMSNITGNVQSFSGSEVIYYQAHKIYTCLFHGGIIR